MKLIIVESPTKARTIKNYLSDFNTIATMGHIKDLPKSKLGVEIDNGFNPNYRILRGKGKRIKEIVSAARKSNDIYVATDPDREGEAIAYHIQEELPVKAKRILFYEMTKSGIKKGIENPMDIDMKKVLSQQTRRIMDRLVGYKISPLLWRILRRGLSAGRVQSVVLRLICEREEKVDNFTPRNYWVFDGIFKHENGKFQAKLWKIKSKSGKLYEKEKAIKVKKELEAAEFIIKKFKKEDRKKHPYPPYITSSLQSGASSRLNFSTKKTMFIAQKLFEGVKLPDGQTGLITYMRTDSFRLSDKAVKDMRKFINSEYGKEYLPERPNKFKSKKGAQEAHEAIRPTDIKKTPQSVKKYLQKDEFKLYSLIWKRAMASQFKPAVFENRSSIIAASDYKFRARSSTLKFPGFYKILGKPNEENEIPMMNEGDSVSLEKLNMETKQTKPPPRYTEASMVKKMENKGIGRPSTYSPTISLLFDRGYIKREKGSLIPLELGKLVNKVLVNNFDSIINCEFTSSMEEKLDKIEEGKEDWQESLKDFYKPFSEKIEEVESRIPQIKASILEKTEKKCPRCGKPLVIKWGKYGKFLACSGYPECKYSEPHPDDILDEKCPECDSKLIIRKGKYGRFISCSNYPDCKYTAPISTGVKCPECKKGEFIERKSKKGKIFYPCSNSECDNVLWDKPVNKKCPECGASFMVKKKGRRGDYLFCIKCKYRERED